MYMYIVFIYICICAVYIIYSGWKKSWPVDRWFIVCIIGFQLFQPSTMGQDFATMMIPD